VAALALGIITLVWHDYSDWPQLRYLFYAAAVAQVFGGAAIQFRRSAKAGAIVLVGGWPTDSWSSRFWVPHPYGFQGCAV